MHRMALLESFRPSFSSISLTTASRCCARLENCFNTSSLTPSIESRVWRLDAIANLLHPFGQFIPINRRAVTNRVIHSPRLQAFPASVHVRRMSRSEHCEIAHQLRIKRAGIHGTNDAATRLPVTRSRSLNAMLAYTSRGEGFEFTERESGRSLLCASINRWSAA